MRSRSTLVGHTIKQNTRMFMSSSDSGEDVSTTSSDPKSEAKTKSAASDLSASLMEQARIARLEADKMEAELTLEKIAKLEKMLAAEMKPKGGKEMSKDEKVRNKKSKESLKAEIEALAMKIDPSLVTSMASQLGTQMKISDITNKDDSLKQSKIETNIYKDASSKFNPVSKVNVITLTDDELTAGVKYFNTLPKPLRVAMAKAIDVDESKTSPHVIVLGICQKGDDIDYEQLKKDYRKALNGEDITTAQPTFFSSDAVGESGNAKRNEDEKVIGINKEYGEIIEENIEEWQYNTFVEEMLPRVTRKEGMEPTQTDVDLFVEKIIDKDIFQMKEKPKKVPGGFIIPGQLGKSAKNGDELISAIDLKVSESIPSFGEKFQACYIADPTAQNAEVENDQLDGDPVLFISSNDFSPTTSRFLLSSVTAISLFFALVFDVATFGNNNAVMDRLMQANDLGNYDLSWFNSLLAPMLLSLGISQAVHELAHLVVAWQNKFKISPPTVLPMLTLPYLSFQSKLKTSPKNYSSLFDFGFSGPAAGMITSLAFLLIGMQLTTTMDASALQNAPSLPVAFLRLSSLGGTIVDYFLGGNGIILGMDPASGVPMHPLAIGGFAGMMINALDSIPFSSTDGGRMSQSLLGRSGHIVFSGSCYFALLIYTIFNDPARDVFLAYLVINGFFQKDLEVPCRNEVDGEGEPGLGRAAAALLIWSMTILTLAPV
eukprot:CAMPEP_0184859464 /NCGR_PEP_ID=MMETSP0580-20130426/4459_1 /TAXON_ID=1118495 /ORGANISM="Dactyliosolen fragilissimus" /LENGTH=715 /DNA_ID=CAMNT_0027356103 /DNA_START=379 /DNA_END=2526 /DNA_ORIENTATION=-